MRHELAAVEFSGPRPCSTRSGGPRATCARRPDHRPRRRTPSQTTRRDWSAGRDRRAGGLSRVSRGRPSRAGRVDGRDAGTWPSPLMLEPVVDGSCPCVSGRDAGRSRGVHREAGRRGREGDVARHTRAADAEDRRGAARRQLPAAWRRRGAATRTGQGSRAPAVERCRRSRAVPSSAGGRGQSAIVGGRHAQRGQALPGCGPRSAQRAMRQRRARRRRTPPTGPRRVARPWHGTAAPRSRTQ